jgi:hypothetical protein
MIQPNCLLLEETPGSTPCKDASYRESMTSVTLDAPEDDDLWNMDISAILEVSETERRSPPGRSASMDLRRMKPERSSCPESSNRQRQLPKRAVSFGNVEVRAFERILSPNPPSCTPRGPSLGLGWTYTEKKPVNLDKFENKGLFPWSGGKRNKDILLTPEKREKLARKYGFSKEEIQANAKAMEKLNKQRKKTVSAFLEAHYEASSVRDKQRQAPCSGL